jgi:hypothetical protein
MKILVVCPEWFAIQFQLNHVDLEDITATFMGIQKE